MLGDADVVSSMSQGGDGNGNGIAGGNPDGILAGGGGGGGDAGERAVGGGGKYSALVPHLLDLVAYQSGVEAVEVSTRILCFECVCNGCVCCVCAVCCFVLDGGLNSNPLA